MKLHLVWMEGMALDRLMRIEFLVSSLLPVAAILVLGLVGTEQIADAGIGVFVFTFILCALASFFGELCITLCMQQALRKRLHALTAVCQDYVSGNKTRRAWVHGDDECAVLARELNTLLDTVAKGPQDMQMVVPTRESAKQEPQDNSPHDQSETSLLHARVKQLLEVITPATSGDLRVRAEVTSDIVGVVADAFNYLIEELVQFVKQMRFASDQVLSVTRDLLDRSIELAKVVETQMLSLSHTTEKLEALVAFTQRLSDTLELSLETSQEIDDRLREEEDLLRQVPENVIGFAILAQETAEIDSTSTMKQVLSLIERLRSDTLGHMKLLKDISHPIQEHTSFAELAMTELYTLARQTHQSSMSVLNTAERISSLAVLAEQWRDSVMPFRLPDDQRQEDVAATKEASFPLTPTLLSSLKNI